MQEHPNESLRRLPLYSSVTCHDSAHVCYAHGRTAGFESGGDYLFNISAASGVVESVASVESVSVER